MWGVCVAIWFVVQWFLACGKISKRNTRAHINNQRNWSNLKFIHHTNNHYILVLRCPFTILVDNCPRAEVVKLLITIPGICMRNCHCELRN